MAKKDDKKPERTPEVRIGFLPYQEDAIRRTLEAKGSFIRGLMDIDRFEPIQMERNPFDREMQTRDFQICGCGDPACPSGPPDTYEAHRRGEIPESVRRAMMANARERSDGRPFVYRSSGPPIGFPAYTSEPAAQAAPNDEEEDKLEDLRDAIKDWVVTPPAQSFSDIIGCEAALGQLRDAIRAPVDHKELYEAYGMRQPKGALLSGPPGCGKTMFARAAASEMRELYGDAAEMISVSGAGLQSPYVGVTEGHIRDIFAYARQYLKVRGHPLLIFIDEAEVLFPDRTGRVRRVAPWEESQVAEFLTQMDGLEASGAFVLLATNRPEVIDQALLRDGRFDFKITVPRPNRDALEGILRGAFEGVLVGADTPDQLVFAALEDLLAPHRVLIDFHVIVSRFEDWMRSQGFEVKEGDGRRQLEMIKQRSFCLEHIVSGAMAASIPRRAIRYAFARDKAAPVEKKRGGKKGPGASGVTVPDVLAAVSDIFEENAGLDHSFALREFMTELQRDLEAVGHKGGGVSHDH